MSESETETTGMGSNAIGNGCICCRLDVIFFSYWRYYLWRYRWTTKYWLNHRWAWPLSTGCLHAVSSKWPVHHGRSGVKLFVYNGRSWLRHTWSDQQTNDAKTQSYIIAVDCIRLCSGLFLDVPCVHAHETAWISTWLSIASTHQHHGDSGKNQFLCDIMWLLLSLLWMFIATVRLLYVFIFSISSGCGVVSLTSLPSPVVAICLHCKSLILLKIYCNKITPEICNKPTAFQRIFYCVIPVIFEILFIDRHTILVRIMNFC